MLKLSGVDTVMTIHNHSDSVQQIFSEVFDGDFHNLIPYEIYAHYLLNSNILSYGEDGEGLVLCAPDKGARDFVKQMYNTLGLTKAKFIMLDKERTAERKVDITLHKESEHTFEGLDGPSSRESASGRGRVHRRWHPSRPRPYPIDTTSEG